MLYVICVSRKSYINCYPVNVSDWKHDCNICVLAVPLNASRGCSNPQSALALLYYFHVAFDLPPASTQLSFMSTCESLPAPGDQFQRAQRQRHRPRWRALGLGCHFIHVPPYGVFAPCPLTRTVIVGLREGLDEMEERGMVVWNTAKMVRQELRVERERFRFKEQHTD